jgi:ABC-type Zn uptake system ZnuABC Zn-binding protein ZnuA
MSIRVECLIGWAIAATVGVLLAACATSDREDGTLRVVTTTAILGEFTRAVAGPDVPVTVIIPPGADPHSFEPTADTARTIATADLVVVNGYHLEGGLLEVVAENISKRAEVVVAARGIPSLASSEEEKEEEPPQGLPAPAVDEGDPHMWLDPELASRYLENIAGGLAAADPKNASSYQERAAAAAMGMRALHDEISASLAAIPEDARRIVVFHDAFGYFARAFGFQLSAGIVPGHGGREPSAAELAEIVSLVREQRVSTVFGEPQFPAGLTETISRETGARVGTLYSDAFGSGVTSYAEIMRANARALVEGLTPR